MRIKNKSSSLLQDLPQVPVRRRHYKEKRHYGDEFATSQEGVRDAIRGSLKSLIWLSRVTLLVNGRQSLTCKEFLNHPNLPWLSAFG
jgi:hypothetical protein